MGAELCPTTLEKRTWNLKGGPFREDSPGCSVAYFITLLASGLLWSYHFAQEVYTIIQGLLNSLVLVYRLFFCISSLVCQSGRSAMLRKSMQRRAP